MSNSTYAALARADEVGPGAQGDVPAAQADELRGPKPGLDGHSQHRPVSPTETGREVRRCEQRVDLEPGEVGDVDMVRALGGDGQDPLDECRVFRMAERGEAEQGVDRCQPSVAGRRDHAPSDLQVIEERSHERGVEVLDRQLGGGRSGGVLHVEQQEPEGVPVGGDGVGTGMTLANEPFSEERLQGRGQRGHRFARSVVVSSRSAATASRWGEAERYQYVEAGLTCPR